MGQSAEFGKFLKAMRSRITPEMAGLPSSPAARRVPGLRREEVARLADVSTDYYTRLEQGRNIHPSRAVLDSVARALLVGEARLSVSRFARTPRQRRRRGVGAYKAAKYASGTLVG